MILVLFYTENAIGSCWSPKIHKYASSRSTHGVCYSTKSVTTNYTILLKFDCKCTEHFRCSRTHAIYNTNETKKKDWKKNNGTRPARLLFLNNFKLNFLVLGIVIVFCIADIQLCVVFFFLFLCVIWRRGE